MGGQANTGRKAKYWFIAASFSLCLTAVLYPARPQAITLTSDAATVVFPPGAEKAASAAIQETPALMAEVGRLLGMKNPPSVTVILLDGAETDEARRLPSWFSGAAYPGQGRVYVKLSRALGGPADIRRTLAHELTHVVLRARVRGNHLPRWLEEGLAMRVSGESSFTQRLDLSWMALRRRIPPLYTLEYSFPQHEDEARVAYAASRHFTAALDRRGAAALAGLLDRVADGEDFYRAFNAVYGLSPASAEREWLRSLISPWRWLGSLGDGAFLWGAMACLIVLAWWRKRIVNKRKLAAMAEEEGDGIDPEAPGAYNSLQGSDDAASLADEARKFTGPPPGQRRWRRW